MRLVILSLAAILMFGTCAHAQMGGGGGYNNYNSQNSYSNNQYSNNNYPPPPPPSYQQPSYQQPSSYQSQSSYSSGGSYGGGQQQYNYFPQQQQYNYKQHYKRNYTQSSTTTSKYTSSYSYSYYQHPSAPAACPIQELGCFSWSPELSSCPFLTIVGGMTNAICASLCASEYYLFSATWGGEDCYCLATFCGTSIGSPLCQGADGGGLQCDVPCSGDNTTFCGSNGEFLDYYTTQINCLPYLTYLINSKFPYTCSSQIVACESLDDPVFDSYILISNSPYNTNDLCAAQCVELAFLEVQAGVAAPPVLFSATVNGTLCYCGNGYTSSVTLSNCDQPCPGNTATPCGDSLYTLATVSLTPINCFTPPSIIVSLDKK